MLENESSIPPTPGVATPTPRNLVAPEVPAALEPLDETAYKIPRSAQSSDLQVDITELWPGSDTVGNGQKTTIYYFWDNSDDLIDPQELEGPYGVEDLPSVSGFIPVSLLAVPGLHSIHYTLDLVSNGNVSPPSLPIMVDVDKVAPNLGQPGGRLVFPPEVADGVTDDYLNDPVNNDRVIATVPRWPDMRLEDVVEGYLTRLPSSQSSQSQILEIVARVVITQAHKDGAEIELIFEGDTLRGLVNAEYSAQYRLIDRAGWEGLPSRNSLLLIDLTPSPVQLPPPEVPQAEAASNNRIDLADAREPGGVYMRLDIRNTLPGDILQPFWNLIPLPSITVGEFQQWPITVRIDWLILAQGGFELTPGTIRADYTWQRGIARPRRSLPRFVPVDFTVAGEVNPANPDPINTLLPPATVKGVTGDDVLTVADRDQDARVLVILGADFFNGQQLELMWADHPVPVDTYPVGPGDREGDEIPFRIPWALIEPIDNAVVNVYYWTFNGVNRQRAVDKPVRVNIAPIVGLQRPKYPDVNYDAGPDSGFIGCTLDPHPSFGVKVAIPGDDTRLKENDEIKLYWAGYASTNGNASTLIENSKGDWSHHLTRDEVRDGYTFTVPFDPHITLPGLVKPPDGASNPKYGSAVTWYEVIRNGVPAGESQRSLVSVTLIRPGGQPPCLVPE